MNTLSNEFLTLHAKPEGAELCSIQTSDGTEHLWQADPAIWSQHAPILFPIIGKLKNDQYTHNGKTYTLSKHGFARNMSFTLLEQTENKLIYQLLATNETKAAYPFDFELRVIYRLKDTNITVEYEVRNHGQDAMPFSIGAHPGFNLPGKLEEYFLTFEKEETRTARLLGDDELLSSEEIRITESSDCIPITQTLFDRDALILLDVNFEKLTIASRKSDTRITVDFSGFPQLGVWAKPGAPYVCIEPWFGYADPIEPYGEISNKPGIQTLPPGEIFRCTHRITIST